MLTTEQINDLHRLYWSEHWPIRKIERHLNMGWKTIKKYLDAPAQGPVTAPASQQARSLQGPPLPNGWRRILTSAPQSSNSDCVRSVITGGPSILHEYVQKVRPQLKAKRAFVRMEPLAGERFEVDWGHFGSLDYSGDKRKLYAFALVDAHSRMLYLEFTHSQSFETFVRCHIHAFTALGGVAREIVYDNLATAVAEHDGRLVRFLPRFLAFAREYSFYPRACNPASGWEKGKVERAIGYLRQNFWPLREFTDLHDVNRQVRQWLAEVANRRAASRNPPAADRSIPAWKHYARCRSFRMTIAIQSKRWCTRISGFSSTAIATACPTAMWAGGSPSKADSSSVTIYDRVEEVVSYARSWRRGQTFGAERFEARAGRATPGGPTLASAATAARFARWSLFPRACGSLSARHGRYRSLARPPDLRTARTDPPVRTRTSCRRNRESRRGACFRRRLRRQHPAPAAIPATPAAAAAVARSALERTGHRSRLFA